jgi:hypothetical protein
MPSSAKSLLDRVVRILNDDTSVRWTTVELVMHLNDGQRDIVTKRPDALNVTETVSLVAGAMQAVPGGAGSKLIGVNANVSSSNKRAITPVERKVLDQQNARWRAITPKAEIFHYCFDPRRPDNFEVYPPAQAGVEIEIEYAKQPTDIATPTLGGTVADVVGNLSLAEFFNNALYNFVLFRCYSKDTEYTANAQRAVSFYQAYMADLGAELQSTAQFTPASMSGMPVAAG